MPNTCGICETIRPTGGTNHLVLNDGEMWIEFCEPCGNKTKLKNKETNEELTIKELFDRAQADTPEDQKEDQFRDDVEADADALSSAGFGTDEDYGGTDERL